MKVPILREIVVEFVDANVSVEKGFFVTRSQRKPEIFSTSQMNPVFWRSQRG